MDIIMNTSFANSLLPRAPMPGFSDNFDRPAGPLGVTSGEGRAWQLASTGGPPLWQASSRGHAVYVGGASIAAAVVDALAADGVFQVTAAIQGSVRRGGPIFRYRDMNNYLFVWQPTPTTGLCMYRRVNGSSTRISESTYIPSDGDVYRVEMNGPNIIFRVNGTSRMTVTETAYMGETRHGLVGTTEAQFMGWDNMSFTP